MSLISVNHLTFCYEDSSENVFEDVSFQIDTDWKLGFVARNGRGKTTFLRLLMKDFEYSGSITCEGSFDYFPFEIKDMEKTFLENIEELYPEYELWKILRELSPAGRGGRLVSSILYFEQRRADKSNVGGSVLAGKQISVDR